MTDPDELIRAAQAAFAATTQPAALENEKARFLGKGGRGTELLKGLAKLPPEEKRSHGARINAAKERIEELLERRRGELAEAELNARLALEAIDVTLPGRRRSAGGIHPVIRTWQRIEEIFGSIGFDLADGPELENDWYNFTALAGPGEPTALSPEAARVLSTRVRTLAAAFGQIRPVAADFPLLLATDFRLSVAAETLTSRLVRLSETPKLLDSNYIAGLLDPFRQEALTSALEPGALRAVTGVSSATTPRELFLNMVRENRLASPAFGTLYGRLGNLSVPLLLSLGILLLVVGIVGAFSGGHPFGRGFAVLTSGFGIAFADNIFSFNFRDYSVIQAQT